MWREVSDHSDRRVRPCVANLGRAAWGFSSRSRARFCSGLASSPMSSSFSSSRCHSTLANLLVTVRSAALTHGLVWYSSWAALSRAWSSLKIESILGSYIIGTTPGPISAFCSRRKPREAAMLSRKVVMLVPPRTSLYHRVREDHQQRRVQEDLS